MAIRNAVPPPNKSSSGRGRWLKECREAAGLSQRQLADLVGAEYHTFISQLETGRGRIPPDRYKAWAQALKIRSRNLCRTRLPGPDRSLGRDGGGA
jgi:transcriptional regulator with XRE-family HTH domain